ncbi:MAG: PKD domain-containing protein [candidate division WOR-3 bacterium]
MRLAVTRYGVIAMLFAGCVGQVPPTVPKLAGPRSGQPGETLWFAVQSQDRNRDNLSYLVDWGDGSIPVWTPEIAADESMTVWHLYGSIGEYGVKARCRDETGRESEWSSEIPVTIMFRGPLTPDRPSGPVTGYPDSMLVFSVQVEHVRGESVTVQFDWGGTLGSWSRPVPHGGTVVDSHRFRRTGTYAVRCRAGDRQGNMSPWSPGLVLNIEPRPVEPPRGLVLSAVNGLLVKLRWSTAGNDSSVRYVVWFRGVLDSGFVALDSVIRNSYVHEPMGNTGDYTVSAVRGDEHRFAPDTLSTVPVFSDTVVLFELNASGHAGYGWDSLTHVGRPRTMLDTASARSVACYFTDFARGHSGPYYYISSPHLGPSDPGGLVPPGNWLRTGLYPLWGNNQSPLPEYDSLLYQPVVEIGSLRTDMAVYRGDGRYALVSTFFPDTAAGTVRVVSWVQTVPALRLIAHRE